MEWKLKDTFAEGNGMQVCRLDESGAETRMTVSETHLNGIGVCQGGALFTLADLAMAALANAAGPSVSTDVVIHFHRAARLGDRLVCSCHLVRDGRLPMLAGEIVNDKNELIATFEGRDYRLK